MIGIIQSSVYLTLNLFCLIKTNLDIQPLKINLTKALICLIK